MQSCMSSVVGEESQVMAIIPDTGNNWHHITLCSLVFRLAAAHLQSLGRELHIYEAGRRGERMLFE